MSLRPNIAEWALVRSAIFYLCYSLESAAETTPCTAGAEGWGGVPQSKHSALWGFPVVRRKDVGDKLEFNELIIFYKSLLLS